MAERELKKRATTSRAGGRRRSRKRRRRPRPSGREAEGRARRPARRDRRGPRGQRRGVRPQLRAEGRRVAAGGAAALSRHRDDPGPSFAALIRRLAGSGAAPIALGSPACGRRDRSAGRPRRCRTARRWSRCATPTAWSWPATGGPPRATPSPTARMEKVFPADRYSAVAIAGAAGPAIEMVRLFQTQLEHYEKVEGVGAQPRGQGQPARPDGARAPPDGDAGPRRGPAVRRLRPAPADRADLHLRRHRRALRGDRLPRHRLGRPRRPDDDQARLPRRAWPATRPSSWPSRRSTRRPTRTRPPAAPTWSGASTRWWPPSTAEGYDRRCADDEVAERFAGARSSAAGGRRGVQP